MKKIRVLLVDDHDLFREGLAKILNSQEDFEVIGEAGDGLEAIIKAEELSPDLILMDVTMPGYDGLEATEQIKAEFPQITIVMLTVNDEDENLFQAIRNGAQGYLLKSIRSQDMLGLLRGALRGEAAIPPALGGRMLEEFRRVSEISMSGEQALSPDELAAYALTEREKEVLSLVAEGASNKEIASALNLSLHTVKSHMRKILAKLHLERRQEAALFAKQKGLLDPTSKRE